MDYLPLHFNLEDRLCLLVGGGEIALRKADLLQQAGARLRIVAPEVDESLRTLARQGDHEILQRAYTSDDINGVALIVAATNDASLNEQVSADACSLNIPVNVVDQPDLCTVIFPAIIDRSPVMLSVSTGGKSPVLTRHLREMIESMVSSGYTRLATFLGDRRDMLKQRFPDTDMRRRRTEDFMASPGAGLAMHGNYDQAEKYLEANGNEEAGVGEVFLVGGGPGDPDLLTLKALHLMQKADVVLHDRLISKDVLSRVRRDARKESVGKSPTENSVPQSEINDRMVELAKAGKRVLRLKGGDPFIFGRGGEEIETLVEHGIPFQVVPGITAASGCASYAGIPLTHRDYSQSVRFVTGHPKDGEVDLEWGEFAHRNQTIVFYMGLGGLRNICEKLISHGREASTPIALVSRGTRPDQEILVGTLETMPDLVASRKVQTPTLIIVGEVVKLHKTLGWTRA